MVKDCNELCLSEAMKQGVQQLHGDISQKQREITLQGFRDGRFRCLVATNVAARGLDIPEVDLVRDGDDSSILFCLIGLRILLGRTNRPPRRRVVGASYPRALGSYQAISFMLTCGFTFR